MAKFSKRYGSFTAWRKAMPRTSAYAQRVIKLHRLNPGATLQQLRKGGSHIITDFSKSSWDLFTKSQKIEYKQALEVLRLMRKKKVSSLTEGAKKVNLSIKTIIKYLGKNVRKIKGRYHVTNSDSLIRRMNFFELGRRTNITVTNYADAHLIGQYFSAVGRLSKYQDENALKPFENVTIIDAEGRKRKFETDPDKVRLILSRIEDIEFFEVYSDE
ncbi:MAG: hypothetical protein ACOCUR_00300 [Nanoarchaeota archaeon]